MPAPIEQYVTVSVVARELGISESAVRALDHELRPARIGQQQTRYYCAKNINRVAMARRATRSAP